MINKPYVDLKKAIAGDNFFYLLYFIENDCIVLEEKVSMVFKKYQYPEKCRIKTIEVFRGDIKIGQYDIKYNIFNYVKIKRQIFFERSDEHYGIRIQPIKSIIAMLNGVHWKEREDEVHFRAAF